SLPAGRRHHHRLAQRRRLRAQSEAVHEARRRDRGRGQRDRHLEKPRRERCLRSPARGQARTSHQLRSRSEKRNEVHPSPRSIGCSSVALEASSRWAFSTSSAEASVNVKRFTGRSGFLRLGIGSTTRYHGVEGCLMYTEILPPPAICKPRTSR